MAEHLEHQLNLQRAIERAVSNFKKLGKEKWTKSVVQTRIVHIKDQWRKYEAGHGKVAAALSSKEQMNHPYFTEDQFAATEEVYLDSLAFMTDVLEQQKQEDKLDSTTRKAWNIKTSDDVTPPSFDTLRAFIDSRVRALEDFKGGADIYPHIILDGIRRGEPGKPIAQNSIFGWIISGPVVANSSRPSDPSTFVVTHHCLADQQLTSEMQRFWEVEEIPLQSLLTPDEEACERHFCDNTSRAPDGRYIVRLPFRSGPPIEIGQSRRVAEKMMHSLSRRLKTSSAISKEYSEFLDEYERLGHMRLAQNSTASSRQCVFIPHHPVFRADSATTHLRVVFNASSLTTNGSSLNDHLFAGPKLQNDLAAVILRWRKFRFVYTADIAKMYRQILIDERDVDYQRILWQPALSASCREYQLLTVTYGMTCAPYLALRVLQRLNEDDGHRFPLAQHILQHHIYVDDVLFGDDDLESLRQSRNQLTALLDCGNFRLRKWASNSSELLTDLDPADHGLACTKLLAPDDQLKVLGVSWSPTLDAFQLRTIVADPLPSTKRSILSTIAKLYDPLGWVTPATVLAKIFLQDLWRIRISWDGKLPEALLDKWRPICERLSLLDSVTLPRWIGSSIRSPSIELHGFADASTVAYAAVVYAKCTSPSGEVTISLLAGKSKVAPLNPLTIPRLELQGALLLSRLMEFVQSTLGTRNLSCVCWTDSTVVLNWVQQHPSRWKTFVANRVSKIQARLPLAEWRHVCTEDNPADCASRGLLSDDLLRSSLWWQGPAWLTRDRSEWPPLQIRIDDTNPLEAKVIPAHSAVLSQPWELETRFSSWPKLIRVTAYLFRFVYACRRSNPETGRAPSRGYGLALSADECSNAKFWWIRRIQSTLFTSERKTLLQNQPLPSKNPLSALNPFLDNQGILRVGGRKIRKAKKYELPGRYWRLFATPLTALLESVDIIVSPELPKSFGHVPNKLPAREAIFGKS
ncbi:uncharacterized protein LOC143363366 [Halictus rubicundus]|uniref:uncharacterized protein LOC143363366 n=1 Tax=Halictus rubicundus TaxID=77578 RepID=UPI004036CC85